jgi:hypothetical protein
MGFAVHRQARHVASMMDENSLYGEDFEGEDNPYMRPVPIWLCVFLVISYIILGTWLFHEWESWNILDSAYFCFITLTTIGKSNGKLSSLTFNYAFSNNAFFLLFLSVITFN